MLRRSSNERLRNGGIMTRLMLSGLVLSLLVAGCSGSPPASSATHTRPAAPAAAVPKGLTSTVASGGLELSAWVPTGSIDARLPLDVRLTFRNNSGRTLRWSRFNFGLLVSTSYKSRGPAYPDGAEISWGPQLENTRAFGRQASPLVLRAGETTSVIHPVRVTPAIWSVKGFAFMDDERLRTPTTTVVAR